ncbi:hypothetical protein QTP88_001721 [Uroleucon formosanum]
MVTHVCLMQLDPTTKYTLLLVFLSCENQCQLLCSSNNIVQCENIDSINEALYIIKSWNEKWVPQYFVTDYCEAEYNSIAKVFNNCPTYICDFHREQAWMRCTNKQGNLHVKDDCGQILNLWRNIAQSNDDIKFKVAVEKMKSTEAWLRNTKAQEYFIRTWLSTEEKWTNRFFRDTFDIKISTNNGVETQNKLLFKNFYLKLTSDKSLNSTIETIIDKFLPESLRKYNLKNLKLTGEYKKMSNVIPKFLHGRPEPFVKHIYNGLSTAQNIYSENKIKKRYSFDDLPEHFLNNPFISADPHYSIKNVHSKEILTKSPINVLEKENGLLLLPSKHSSKQLLDIPKSHKKKKLP